MIVGKAANPVQLLRHSGEARWAALGGGTALAAGGAELESRRRQNGRGRNARNAIVGAAAGQGAYQSATYGLKNRALAQDLASGISRAKRDKTLKPVKSEHGAFTAQMYRNYPKELPGWKAHRAAGYVGRGRTGMAVGAAATAGGAYGFGRRQRVGKAHNGLVYEHQKTSAVRAAELGVGLGALALGGPRLKLIGAASARGARVAGTGRAPKALIQAESARRAWLTGSKPAYDKLPAQFQRPGLLAAGGALAASDAVPIKRTTYTPVRGAY